MPIVATAGHVDHGKSTLVQALTGRDPDRWREEKERGLTIDLGFAWADLGVGELVGFVDVPGHERFIKNMLAGIGAVDVALFVVAADEGWMPQSEEHAAVLDVLGVRRGVVALTRTDLVDEETMQLAHLDVIEHTEGTGLAAWPVVPVSAVTGDGIAELEAALTAGLTAAGAAVDVGRPRLWVDRSFLISGAGLVITGTLLGGSIRLGDELDLWPGPQRVRVRGLQRHEMSVEEVGPGARTAVNIVGVDRTDVERGAMVSAPGQIRPSRRLLVDLTTVRAIEEPLTNRGAYQVHLGTGAWPARLRLLEGAELIGTGSALLQLDAPAPVAMADRFVLRETGRRAVVAGGVVLDPDPPGTAAELRAAASSLRATLAGSVDERATALLEVRGSASLRSLEADSQGGRPAAAVVTDTSALSPSAVAAYTEALEQAVASYHDEHPLRAGIPRAALTTTTGLPPEVLTALLNDSPRLVDDGATVRSAGFSGGRIEDAAWADARQMLLEAGLAAPRESSLGLDREVTHSLVRQGDLVRVAADLVYLPEQIEQIKAALEGLPDEFTVADFRDALGVSRRQAVPLLEYLDARGITRRRGDVRTVR